jgi:hypothetical protein
MLESRLEAICTIPVVLKRNDQGNEYSLLRASGYQDDPASITETLIEEYLRAHPELVKAWLHLSEDNRSSPSWYLIGPKTESPEAGGWTVGFVPGPIPPVPVQVFATGYAACAHFIKMRAEQLRNRS